MSYVSMLKALADENRLVIMCYLREGKKCVCEIEQLLSISQSATSKHLIRLKAEGLIEAEKTAQWVYYHIPDKMYAEYPFLDTLLSDARTSYVFSAAKITKEDC